MPTYQHIVFIVVSYAASTICYFLGWNAGFRIGTDDERSRWRNTFTRRKVSEYD